MSLGLFKKVIYNICLQIIYISNIYVKQNLALNNLQWLICHKTKQTTPNQFAAC